MTLNEFQAHVQKWLYLVFKDQEGRTSYQVRVFRFYEEATELAQATDLTREEAHRMVDWVYDRKKGEVVRELGGTMTTLAALTTASGFTLNHVAVTELERVNDPDVILRVRVRQLTKNELFPTGGQ
jgi:hypothetical protein